MDRDLSLRDLAEPAGFSPSNLAALVGVNEATIYRVWLSHTWGREMQGAVINRLISVVPGVAAYLGHAAWREREKELLRKFDKLGVPAEPMALRRLADSSGMVREYLYNGLEAAACIVAGDQAQAVRVLTTCWGREQSRALDAVFGTANGSPAILKDSQRLVDASIKMLDSILQENYSFNRALAGSHLAHYIAKSTGELPDVRDGKGRRRGIAAEHAQFGIRAGYMGKLRRTTDLDLAAKYREQVNSNGIVRVVELWAFPSWTRDLPNVSNNFSVPRGLHLRGTATEVLDEIESYNDAYVWYLVSVFVPLALEEVDPHFGGRLRELRAALMRRAEVTELPELAFACRKLSAHIAEEME